MRLESWILAAKRAALQVLVALQIEQRIFAVLAIEFLRHVIDDDVVPILAAEPMIAVGRDHLDVWPSIRMIVTSNVPPPRSKTKTVWSSSSLSRP